MQTLQSLAEELFLRQRIKARIENDDIILALEGQSLFVSRDETHDRIVIWAEIAAFEQRDLATVARISLAYNDEFAVPRAVTMGVSQDGGRVFLGRSLEAEAIDAGRLMNEAQDFAREAQSCHAWLRRAMAPERAHHQRSSSIGLGDNHTIRVK